MSSDYHIHRNRLIAGLVILGVLLILVIFSAVVFVLPRDGQAQVGHRSPVAELTYCDAEHDRLCIVSFSQEVDGAMLVNFLIPHASFPKFFLIISYNGVESRYECERVEESPKSVYCFGDAQAPGYVLQFKVISKNKGILLAEGSFGIIGIALSTPEIPGTISAADLTVSPTPSLVPRTSTPVPGILTPTLTTPSPSYPNPYP